MRWSATSTSYRRARPIVDHLGRTQTYSRPQRHRVSPRAVVLPRLDVPSQARIQHHAVDGALESAGEHHRQPRLSLSQGLHARRSAVDGMPGIRSLVGSHPYWLAPDRTMAEEFVRPGFTSALVATGEVLPGLFYKLSFGNNISQLGITAAQLTRDIAVGASIWWMPTTQGVRTARRLRRLGEPRGRRHALRHLERARARGPLHAARPAAGQHADPPRRRHAALRHRRAGAQRDLAERDLLDPVRRRRPEVSRPLHSRPSTARAGSTISSATAPSR